MASTLILCKICVSIKSIIFTYAEIYKRQKVPASLRLSFMVSRECSFSSSDTTLEEKTVLQANYYRLSVRRRLRCRGNLSSFLVIITTVELLANSLYSLICVTMRSRDRNKTAQVVAVNEWWSLKNYFCAEHKWDR